MTYFNIFISNTGFSSLSFFSEIVPASNLTVLHSEELQCNSKEVKEIIKKVAYEEKGFLVFCITIQMSFGGVGIDLTTCKS